MSGLNPLAAALAAQAAAGAQAAIDEAILSIGDNLAVLQSQVSVGDVVTATVLPPQGGTDLLSFLGQTVPAQIPAGIDPGESLLLQVTGFTNNAVIVRNLGTVDPENPVPTVDVQLPPAAPGSAQSAVLTTVVPQSPEPAQPLPVPQSVSPPAQAQLPPGTVAPPREVFVAAAVRAAPPATPREGAPLRPAIVAPEIADGSDVEARIALNRASASPLPAPLANSPARGATPASAPAAEAPLQGAADPHVPGRLPVAPPIVFAAVPRASAATPGPQAAPALESSDVPQTPEAELLTRLSVPVTPATLAAARLAGSATENVTAAFERLEALLGRLAPQQIPAALRSVLGFVSRMDMRNSSALPEQIAAFVSDVVDGPEAKIAQAVQAWLELSPEPPEPTPAPAAPPLPGAPLAQPAAQAALPPPPAAVTTAAAQVAERTVALQFDPKSAIMAMIAEQTDTPSSAALAGALRDALVATTAVQLGSLAAQTNNPSAITLALPAYFYEGGAPVQLQISRDAPNSKNKMDGDNFHIAFILDTQSLGTVAIDVQTVGRAVSVDVKTQGSSAAERFRNSLGDLRGRLERLRYRVSNIGAGIAAPLGAPPAKAAEPEKPARRGLWDTRA